MSVFSTLMAPEAIDEEISAQQMELRKGVVEGFNLGAQEETSRPSLTFDTPLKINRVRQYLAVKKTNRHEPAKKTLVGE